MTNTPVYDSLFYLYHSNALSIHTWSMLVSLQAIEETSA